MQTTKAKASLKPVASQCLPKIFAIVWLRKATKPVLTK